MAREPRRRCWGCGEKRRKIDFPRGGQRCRECSGAPPKDAERPGSLAAMTDLQAARLYESALAIVERGTLDRTDPRYRDAHDELEIRTQERWIIAAGRWIYSWDRDNGTFRRRLAGLGGRGRPRRDTAEDKRVYKTPEFRFEVAV